MFTISGRICRYLSCVEANAVAESGIIHLQFAGFQRQVFAASVLMMLIWHGSLTYGIIKLLTVLSQSYDSIFTSHIPLLLSPKSITLAGPKPAQNLLETCVLAGLRLAWLCMSCRMPKVHRASKSEDLFMPRVQSLLFEYWNTSEILVHANSFSSPDEFTSVFHILGLFCSALIKFFVFANNVHRILFRSLLKTITILR